MFPNLKFKKNFVVKDIRTLNIANKGEITFFDSVNYKDIAAKTKASACITTEKIQKHLPDNLYKIIVKNVLFELARVTS